MASYKRRATAAAVLAISFVAARSTYAQDAANVADQVTIFPVPGGLHFQRAMVGADGPVAAGPAEKLVYSNTLGTFGAALGANRLAADDITTTVAGGCRLRRFEFPVVGKVDPAGIGGPYSLDFALYSNCPGSVPAALRPGLIIPGTQGQAVFADDAPRLISFAAPANVLLPTNFWFGVKFSRNNAGVVIGSPPLTGFSCDQFDFPGFPCNATLGGFPDQPHASFNLEIYADSACADSFTGYKNSKPSGPTFNPGRDIFLVDDIQLSASSCNMIAYEVAVRGIGNYSFEMRSNCESGLIAGTQRIAAVGVGTEVKIQRYTFNPPIALPQNLWFTAKVNNDLGSVVISGQQACIGTTADLLGTVMDNACVIIPPGDLGIGIHGAFNLAITCAGTAPVGACCDMIFTDENGDSVCREAPQMNCPWPPRFTDLEPKWVEGATCDSDPFLHPCGVAACCRPDQVCENLTLNECYAIPPIDRPRQWQKGRYCDQDWQRCPMVACLAREGDCLVAHQEGGCEDPLCCTDVCNTDSYCCLVEWDRVCVQLAEQLCPNAVRHDECLVGLQSALLVEAVSSTFISNLVATEVASDPGFCCRADAPGAKGFGTVWFKFVATDTSARISTCNSDLGNDSLIQAFAAGDPSSEEAACNSLTMIGCSDDVEGCSTSGHHGQVCIKGLTPGDTYYVMLAAKTPETKGLYELEIRSPCYAEPIWNPNDCNENKLPDGCELGRGTAADCNGNDILDECDITSGTSFDCDANAIPDDCDGLIETLTPKPALPSGAFGTSVVMDGPWLVVGSGFEFTQEPRANNPLHIYRRTLVGWKIAQTIDFPLPPTYVGMDDGWIAVTSDLGSVAHLLRLDGDLWVHSNSIQGPAIGGCARSGYPLAIDGDAIALSKGFCQYRLSESEELVFVFRRNGLNWVKEAQLMAPSGSGLNSYFGASVALAGDRLIVGAPDTFSLSRPSAHVFRRENESWAFETTLYPPDEKPPALFFGRSVAFDGRTAVVGATLASSEPFGETGAAYVFAFDGTAWSYEAKLFASDGSYRFGFSVAIAGNTAVIGAIYDATYTFHRQGTQWIEQFKLSPPSGKNVAYFGYGVATDGALVAVGAPGFDSATLTDTGSVYVFQPPKADCNENDIPDLCDVRDTTSPDCNHDDWPDECTVTDGTTPDCNQNRIPDGCENLPPFDFDFDGNVDLIDLAGFQRCFTGPGPAAVAPCCRLFDVPPDGDVDAADWAEFLVLFQGP